MPSSPVRLYLRGLEKSGTTFLQRCLENAFEVHVETHNKHGPVPKLRTKQEIDDPVLCIVRGPWNWLPCYRRFAERADGVRRDIHGQLKLWFWHNRALKDAEVARSDVTVVYWENMAREPEHQLRALGGTLGLERAHAWSEAKVPQENAKPYKGSEDPASDENGHFDPSYYLDGYFMREFTEEQRNTMEAVGRQDWFKEECGRLGYDHRPPQT